MHTQSIIKNALLQGAAVEKLRQDVGWEACTGLYDDVLKRSYSHYSVSTPQRMIAFLNVLSDGISYALLTDLMVHPSAQRSGLGTELLKWAIKDLTSVGVRYIQAVHEPALDGFYRKAGFSIIHAASLKVEKSN